ncbi:hybrid NRPS/PKS enzyme [Apiospora rasikravindrae]|uniref:Hybrid NRPS/PKS enzyme n=1 Tax=Apiospora rasikravindrae TaxID=990691 RepID=A0ABR1RP21_9PEZI
MVFQIPEPIAIVGSGCRFPGGSSSPSKLWKLIEKPRDVVKEIPPERFDTTGFYHQDGTHHGSTNVRHSYLIQEDLKVFDAAFFNISPNEADSMDPQQRLVLETVYEALEAGGHTMEALRGSNTAVYVGTMGVDYNDTLLRDLSTIPTYFATGTNRAIISNRISYFFDWHGPSMTIDTACSSSLIAVHQGVQLLRTGQSRVAVAAGTQVILGPEVFIFESKMKMLSPTGRSRMWDSEADGYARGEGVAAIVMKRLSDAIADGDHIECLIRETGANQDGFSNGITVPSTKAQADLIMEVYGRAGLDPANNPEDRPQFFEAHGTGTKAGDPKEAAAIHQCFGQYASPDQPVYVGSVKTVIGHTEGAAGLAGLLKGSGIIQHGSTPAIEPFYKGLHVPTSIKPWPKLPSHVPRRVSVNSFGFGGSNAHAILEEYRPSPPAAIEAAEPQSPVTPFVFSAVSEASLVAQLQAYSEYLAATPDVNPVDLAWTLQSRRSQLPFKVAFSAATIDELQTKIDAKLAPLKQNPGVAVGTRANIKGEAHVLGVFTGQGAQWPAMGAELIRSFPFVRQRVQQLEEHLNSLPDRPQWSLVEEMLAGDDTSRIAEAALSQPLCTAIQIVLVDLLKAAGVTFSSVVGHSSGEMGAAYAAGFLSDCDALRAAYYRGVVAKLAGNAATGQKGAMLAVGTSWEDAEELVNLRAFKGRIAIAAHNSSASVTLSGDADAIAHAKRVFDEEKKFARALKVDTAYHSHHMYPCGEAYVSALQACGVQVKEDRDGSCSWFSSPVEASASLAAVYWKDNMQNAVRFADAVKNAVASDPQIAYAIEVGPHPALKGPAVQNIADVQTGAFPYTGVLSRGKNDVQSFSDALGFIWTLLGSRGVSFPGYQGLVSGPDSKTKLVTGLPSYRWNHNRVHWQESRKSRQTRGRKQPPHELLGVRDPDSNEREIRWQNVLKVSEIPWLEGHQLQGQCVFPAAGYCAMAIEASRILAAGKSITVLELHDLTIPRAITFEDDTNAGVETVFSLTSITTVGKVTTADFALYSCPTSAAENELELMASGSIKVEFGEPDLNALASTSLSSSNMAPVETDRFYDSLSKLGYGYYQNFRGMSDLRRRFNQSSVLVDSYPYSTSESTVYLVHPTWLDVSFQASMLAFSAPGDERLWSLHVPTSIRSIRINPEVCSSLPLSQKKLRCTASLANTDDFAASIDIFTEGGALAMVQVEDLEIKPFAPATEADDRRLFSYTKIANASPEGSSIPQGAKPTAEQAELAVLCERVSLHYLRKWKAEITDQDWANAQPHHAGLRDYMNHMLELASQGRHPTLKKEWLNDTPETIKDLLSQSSAVDITLLCAVGENIPAAVSGETTILEHMLPNNLLDDFYKQGLGFAIYNTFLARMLEQFVHRYPHARILEIGAGTGGATKAVLEKIGNKMSSYTYTDISVGFFEKAAVLFKEYSDKMVFKTLDVEKGPATQGYELHSYDVVIASNVLHATSSMQKTLEHTRQLLKPGGYLFLLEITDNGAVRFSNIMGGLSGWWMGIDDGRKYAPTITPSEWHNALRKAGFGGVDAITPEIDTVAWPLSIMAAQAVDDSINYLRKPLARVANKKAPFIFIDNLVIMGGASLEGARLVEEISEVLDRFCGEITVLDNLPTSAEAETIGSMSTFINLVDIDSPIFKDVTSEKMEGLNRMYELAKNILWVTVNAQLGEPYHMASITFSRAMHHEYNHINMNHLDVPALDDNVSKAIAEHLLRSIAVDEWDGQGGYSKQRGSFLWSKEPECYLEKNQLKVPRVVHNVGQNARLNSIRRTITTNVPAASSNFAVMPSENSALALVDQPLPTTGDAPAVNVQSSSVQAINVAADAFLYVSMGEDTASKDTVVALSLSNLRETAPIVSVAAGGAPESADRLLVGVSSELQAASLLQNVSAKSSVLVHLSGQDGILASAIERLASAKSIRVAFSISADQADSATPASWIKLSPRAPRHAIQTLLSPVKATHFLDLVHDGDLSQTVARVLPSATKTISHAELSQAKSQLPPSYAVEDLKARLSEAVSRAREAPAKEVEDLVVQVADIGSSPLAIHSTSAVSWAHEGQVNVQFRKLDSERLFAPDKTYLMLGLTGQIGQSLCEWMIQNGAGTVILTSRNPKVDPLWLESVQKSGSTVKVFSLDVTNKSAIESLVKEIKATCAPIAGVANGAMVLQDCLFSKMTVDVMQKVLGPKIDGSRYLDEIFYDDDLDFFILFSSSACVIGNSGQSNYAAANGYLNTLSRQRRRRGLAASTFDIGRVAGIGYVETAGQAVIDQLTRFGLMAISEAEFRQVFAETIRAGYYVPGDKETIPASIVTTGIRTIRDDEEIQGPWFDNALFSHCIIEAKSAESDGGQSGKKVSLPVTEQLACAANEEQAVKVLQDCFSAKIKVILQLADQEIDPEASLVELGVDSLVAVEVRSWFLKELKVDIPVLKVVGGASVAELCQIAFKKLPEELVATIGTGDASKIAPKASSASADPVAAPKVESPAASSSSSSAPSGTSSPKSETSPANLLTPATELGSRSASPMTEAAAAGTSTFLEPKKAAVARPMRKFLKTEQISFGQSRFWFLRLLLEDQTTSNVAFYYKVAGSLRVGDLERAVRIVVARHEALRTAFVEHETRADQAYQKVIGNSPIRLELKEAKSFEEVETEYHELQKHVFDLESGQLIRIVLVTLTPTLHYILFNYHHIAMDGVSFQIFVQDLEKAYKGEPLGPSPRQFPDYSRAQREAYDSGEMADELKYWRSVFPADQQPPVLPLLPMARTASRGAMKVFGVHQVMHRIDADLMTRIKTVCKSRRSTPFHFYLAAYKAMLFSFTQTKDLTIGIADANRTDRDVNNSIGFFLNLLTLRFRRQDNQRFSEAVSEARDTTYAALGNSRLPFDVLLNELNVARSSTHAPFFQAFFDYRQGAQENHPWGNTQWEFQEVHPGRTAYDITLDVTDSGSGSLIIFRVQKGLYDLTAAKLLMETYTHFLEFLSANPESALNKTPLFSQQQLTQATEISRGPKLVSEWPETLPLRIDQVAHENQSKTAIKDGHGSSWTYSALIQRIEAIAEALQKAGVGASGRVLVFQTASADWVASMLAIMRIGAIYVPLDLRNPLPRLASVAVDCEPVAVLADNTTAGDFEQLNVPKAALINVSSLSSTPSAPVANVSKSTDTAAILYTSGSTGLPKGIMVTHAGLRNEIEGYTSMWKLGAERTLQQSAFTFNHSSDQIYTGLTNGGMVYVVPWDKRGDPLEITKILKEECITYTKATPAEYSLWMQFGGETLRGATSWRAAFGGGETLPSTLTKEFADLGLSQLRVYNSYGPTEISISSTKMEVDYRNQSAMEEGRIPCGFSLPNYFAYIVDEQLKPLPAGMPGELYIGGAGVSQGYLNNKELTDQHFVTNPFATPEDIANNWTRMYRTNDICHLREDGAMVFHSRVAGDTQVKIRGLRIELNDIESNIVAASNGVLREAVVTLRQGDPDFLVAHVVFAPSQEPGDADAYLANLLSNLPIPQYMIPVLAIPIDKIPLTNHSKTDRKALMSLPLPQRATSAQEGESELTSTMTQLKTVWQTVLGNSQLAFDITPSTSFFLVGGNSLLVIRLQSQIRQIFNVTVRLVDLLGNNTLGGMARKIEESSKSISGAPKSASKTVLVLGATGLLSKTLLPQLLANPAIAKIHAVAVRDVSKLPADSPKLVVHTGDLVSPRLGLSQETFKVLASEVDVILHLGAVRSFWDNYHTLRPINVNPTKEVVKLAGPRKIPVHYISTFGVLLRDSTAAASAASNPPATDGSNGYVASRWASERILERASETLGVPVSVNRFLPTPEDNTTTPKEILDEFVRFVDLSAQFPDMSGWEGRIDMVPATQASTLLHDHAVADAAPKTAKFHHVQSTVAVHVAGLREHITKERGTAGLETMPGLRWIGRIKQLGFNYFLTTQEAAVGGGSQSEAFESRR